jgi:hypothetical protein
LREDFVQTALAVNARYYQSFSRLHESGVRVMDEDWDNLVILNACRYDLFEEFAPFDGETRSVLSRAGESWGFMQENFVGRSLHDTVYVTSNPHAFKIPNGAFHAIDNLLEDTWDESVQTVRPEAVVERTKEAIDAYPNKRVISHFMQPHFPFLGPTGRELDHEGLELHLDDDEHSGFPNPWLALMYGEETDERRVIRAYRENYEIVLPHVRALVEDLPGRTAITADHGNLLGERTFPVPIRTFGHHPGIYKRELLEVPWTTVQSESRRRVRADPPVGQTAMTENVVRDRFRNLGYRA